MLNKTALLCTLLSLALAIFYACVARLMHATPPFAAGVGIGTFLTGMWGLPLIVREKSH